MKLVEKYLWGLPLLLAACQPSPPQTGCRCHDEPLAPSETEATEADANPQYYEYRSEESTASPKASEN